MKLKLLNIFLCLISLISVTTSFSATIPDPCANLLSVVNRPTVADSACVVSDKHALLELGYQYQNLKGGGNAYNLPQAEFRLGLAGNNEVSIVLPNYNHQSMASQVGYNATSLGFKHEIGYDKHWLGAVDGLITLPSGSAAFGSNDFGATLNGVVVYNFNPNLSLAFMMGIRSQTLPHSEGGERFTSINPDLVLSWQFDDKSATYFEAYGQNKTAPGVGSGFNSDIGFLYLPTSYIEVDLELGQHISGSLAGFNNYVGTGVSFFL
jgi:hypothetical protein